MKLAAPLAACLILLAGCTSPISKEGDAAPDFTVQDSDGLTVSLSDFEGRPVVLFFASMTSCPSCIKATRDTLVPLHAEVGDEVAFLSLSILPQYESNEDIQNFKDETGATWSHAQDTDDVAKKYDIFTQSVTVVLDADHRVVLSEYEASSKQIRDALE